MLSVISKEAVRTSNTKEEVAHNLVKAMMVLKGMLNLSSVMNRREHFRDMGPHGACRGKRR